MCTSESISGWRLSPKVGRVFALFMVFQGPIAYFREPLGIPDILVYLSFTMTLLCASTFALPHAAIWQKVTED